jgi:hypothetical protein
MIKHTYFYLFIVSTILCACTKPPDFPPEPTIKFGSIVNNIIQQAQDTAYVTIKFTDGDGDIGFFDNIQDIFLTDTRPSQNGAVTALVMPMVPELGSENGISGEIRFPIIEPCCTPPPGIAGCLPVSDDFPEFQRDTLIYEMYIEDRAGNKSNTIILEPIFLLCD